MSIKDLIFIIKPLSFKDALEYLVKSAQTDGKKTFVVTINPEIIMLARSDQEYEKVLKSADLALADGIGVVWAAKIFGKLVNGRIHGADLVEKLSERAAKYPITVGFLGGRGNVADKTAECLVKKYPGLKVAFAVSEWPEKLDDRRLKIENRTLRIEDRKSINLQSSTFKGPSSIIHNPSSNNRMSADILFVAFGSPKQEKWIYENLPDIDVRVAIGIGGAFDFISGNVRRAPVWLRSLGLEWLFRLLIQPWRIKRQLALPKFVILVLIERFFRK